MTHDVPYPEGYCDVITFSITIQNTGTASSFTGRIEILPLEWEIIDLSDLPGLNVLYNQGSGSYWTFIEFTTPTVAQNDIVSYDYQLVLQSFYDNQFKTINRVTRTANSELQTEDEEVLSDIVKPIPYPNYASYHASDLLDDYDDGAGPLVLIPVDPILGLPDWYACNPSTTQNLYVHDQLVFDIPEYCIYNNTGHGYIIVNEGGQIIIEEGASLKIDGQRIRSCDKMWKGFLVKSGGSLSLSNCVVENARYGIQAERGAHISSTNTLYKDNYIGLYVPPVFTAPDPENPSENYVTLHPFNGNVFGGSGSMLSPYDGQTPAPGELPFAGIEVNHVSPFIVPGLEQNPNFFENMQNGVIARNSTLSLGFGHFKDINRDPEVQQKLQGYGIYLDDCRYAEIYDNTGGSFASYTHNFYNCNIGIYNLKGALSVSGVTMQDVETGIWLDRVLNKSIDLTENDIEAERTGILLNHCAPLAGFGKVEYNTILVSGHGDESVCIEINDLPIPTR